VPALLAASMIMLPLAISTLLPSSSISIIFCLSSGRPKKGRHPLGGPRTNSERGGSCCTRSDVGRDHAGLVCHVIFKFRTEVLEHRPHRHGGGISQGANRAPHDVLGHVVEQVHIGRATLTIFDAIDNAREPAGTFAAWRALATGFVHVEVTQTLQALDHATTIV